MAAASAGRARRMQIMRRDSVPKCGPVPSGPALQDCGEEAVRAMPGGTGEQVIALGRRRSGQSGRAPGRGQGERGEVRMAAEEGGDLVLVLLGQQGAGSVDQTSARTHQVPCNIKNFILFRAEFAQ